jgi:hypothetical protein
MQIQNLVTRVLPGAACTSDATTGSIAIGVSRRDIMHLPRLFAWLETSRKAASLVREWSISNTTLEQVFLQLCIQNTEVNYVDRRNEADESMCAMCRERPKETALLRTLTGQIIIIPNSICSQCSSGNSHYVVSEEEGLSAGGDPMRVNALLTKIQTKAALDMAQAALIEQSSILEDEGSGTELTTLYPLLITSEGDEHTQLCSDEERKSTSGYASGVGFASESLRGASGPGRRGGALVSEDPFKRVVGGSPSTQVRRSLPWTGSLTDGHIIR